MCVTPDSQDTSTDVEKRRNVCFVLTRGICYMSYAKFTNTVVTHDNVPESRIS